MINNCHEQQWHVCWHQGHLTELQSPLRCSPNDDSPMLQLRWDSARRCHTWVPPLRMAERNWRPKDVQRSHVSYVTSSFLVGFSVWCCMILYAHTFPPIQPRTIQTWPSSSWRRSSNPWSTPLCTWTRLASKSPEQSISLMLQKYFFGSSSVYLCSIWHPVLLGVSPVPPTQSGTGSRSL